MSQRNPSPQSLGFLHFFKPKTGPRRSCAKNWVTGAWLAALRVSLDPEFIPTGPQLSIPSRPAAYCWFCCPELPKVSLPKLPVAAILVVAERPVVVLLWVVEVVCPTATTNERENLQAFPHDAKVGLRIPKRNNWSSLPWEIQAQSAAYRNILAML